MVQVLVVRVDLGVVTYEATTPQVQALVVRVDIGVVIYEVVTPQHGRSVAQVLATICYLKPVQYSVGDVYISCTEHNWKLKFSVQTHLT